MPNEEKLKWWQDLAVSKDGVLLSNNYINSNFKLKFECKKCNHIWNAFPGNVKNKNSWCPNCAGQLKVTIKDAQNIASLYGGKCLSTALKNARSKLLWECENHHKWECVFDRVKNNNAWCKFCLPKNINIVKFLNNQETQTKPIKQNISELRCKIFLQEAHDIAEKCFGKCLDINYLNYHTPLNFECKFGHQFQKTLGRLKGGYWCPECRGSLSERICRFYFETIFKHKFVKIRPEWLRNENGKKIELDGYCSELNLAFEHNGQQHYKESEYFNSNLLRIQKNDLVKSTICKNKGIKLIVVPDLFNMLGIENLKSFLKKECIKLNIKLPNDYDQLEINHLEIYKQDPGNHKQVHTLEEFQKIAREKNGECLSDFYHSTGQYLKFKCYKHNYIWDTKANHILDGTWCVECQMENARWSIEEVRQIAANSNIECLSSDIKSMYDELTWRCCCGNEFIRKFSVLKKGSFYCKNCAINNRYKTNAKYTINDLQIFASQNNGVCLSESYFGVYFKYLWKCKNDHIFEKNFTVMKNNDNFCTQCIWPKYLY